jgi:hypothetical protein
MIVLNVTYKLITVNKIAIKINKTMQMEIFKVKS